MRRIILLFLFAVYCCHSGLAVNNTLDYIEESDNEIEPAPRIVGGTAVNLFNRLYTFVARLQVHFAFGSNTVCSGVVLGTKHILTVAHCVSRPGRERAKSVWARIIGGGIYLFRSNDILLHPKYDGLYGYDVALLKKNDWIFPTFMRGFTTVPRLPTTDDAISDNTPAVIAGWGKTSDTNRYSITLRYANVVILPETDQLCETTYKDAIASMPDDRLLCTSWNSAGLCAGDWGGPLLTTRDGATQLIGLNLLRTTESCTTNTPSGYLFLKQLYVEWINTHMK